MFWSRRRISFFGRIVAAALLFVHFAFAAQACVIPDMTPATIIADGIAGGPCQDMDKTLCLAQSLLSDQALDTTHASYVPSADVAPVPVIFSDHPRAIPSSRSLLLAKSALPIRLRNCRLLI